MSIYYHENTKTFHLTNGAVSYLISGSEISGNYLAVVKNGVCTFEEHSREKLVSKLKSMLGGEF